MRVSVIEREDPDEAWLVAEEHCLEDCKSRVANALAIHVTGSEWHREPSDLGAEMAGRSLYWLRPFDNYETRSYLVRSYVADEVARYLGVGFTTFILDMPPSEDELRHTAVVFERARSRNEALGGAGR
jgi:alkanesulfonate monooxygenase